MDNTSTLADLKQKTTEWNSKFLQSKSQTIEVFKKDYEKKYFNLNYINKQDSKAYVIEKMSVKYKLSDLKKKLEKNNKNLKDMLDETHVFKLTFTGGDMDA